MPRFARFPSRLPLLAPFAASARDLWFPDGPVQPQIPHGVMLPPKTRTPQFPLKTARTLHSDAEIAQLRANIAHYPTAAALAKACITEAGYWLLWSDQDLHDLVTTAEVPRAVELCNTGCPIHGRKIFEGINGSSFPWIVDPKHPFQVKCRIGGEVYPSNDYGAYYRSGFKDKASLTGPYVDDGWGWTARTARSIGSSRTPITSSGKARASTAAASSTPSSPSAAPTSSPAIATTPTRPPSSSAASPRSTRT